MEDTCSSHTNIFADLQTKRNSRSKQTRRINRKDVKKSKTLTDLENHPSTSATQILPTRPIFHNISDTTQYHGDQNQQPQNSPEEGVNQTPSTTKKRKHSIYKRKTSDLLLPGGLDLMQNASLSTVSNRTSTTSKLGDRSYVIPPPDQKCPYCSAIVWKEEMIKGSTIKDNHYTLCCNNGQVILEELRKTPDILDMMLDPSNHDAIAKKFQKDIRRFNSMFSFTSFGAQIDSSVMDGRGPFTFRIHGQNYHLIGSLLPKNDLPPRYAQLYIYDTEHEIENRYKSMPQSINVSDNEKHIDEEIIKRLQTVLDDNNLYVQDFRKVRDWYEANKISTLNLTIIDNTSSGHKNYARPSADEIAGLMIGDSLQVLKEREIVVQDQRTGFQRISETNASYMPLQYPLLFPFDLCVIEFQKRGLPHAHILLTLDNQHKLLDTKQIDMVISAELPDPNLEPEIFTLVLNHMIHGPCGVISPHSPCMKKGRCSKGYPKEFVETTELNDKGFTLYRRRRNAIVGFVHSHEINNTWVVPYNKELLHKFQCHINVEKCNQKTMIKYLYKYIHKGYDMATLIVQNPACKNNEIQRYLESRYISASEAAWRLFDFRMHIRHPPVQRLQYHLENQQTVFFYENSNLEDIHQNYRSHMTMLTAWFENNRYNDTSRHLLYTQIPNHYIWDKRSLHWYPRKKGFSIARLPFAHPSAGERYYLRMLLNVIPGATSFESLRTVNGIVYATYKEACISLGLLEDDNEWDLVLSEAIIWASPKQLRKLFTTLLLYSEVSNPKRLWLKYADSMSEDYEYRIRQENPSRKFLLGLDWFRNQALIDIEEMLEHHDKSLADFPPMEKPDYTRDIAETNTYIIEQLNYDKEKLEEEAILLETTLNSEQRTIYEKIHNSKMASSGELFFIYGGGGSGKTYLWNCLITKLRSKGKIVLVVASSGIASLLLPGGRTAHSRFKIPLKLDEDSTCSISKQGKLARLIEITDLVIWDEAPMMTRYAFDAVDKSFKDIMSNLSQESASKPFGGKTVVLGGDFRQILPVIPHGNREHIVAASLHKSDLWIQCKLLLLTRNMRLQQTLTSTSKKTLNESVYADWIMKMGNGELDGIIIGNNSDTQWIPIPHEMLLPKGAKIEDLINVVYSDIDSLHSHPDILQNSAILASRNEDVDMINDKIIENLQGELRTYYSADSKVDITPLVQEDTLLYTTEFLNTIKCSEITVSVMHIRFRADGKCPSSNCHAAALYEWATNKFSLKILEHRDLLFPDRLITLDVYEDVKTIRQVKAETPAELHDNQVLKFVVHGTIIDIDVHHQIYYDACDQCNRSPGDRSNPANACIFCGKSPVTVVPRFLLTMTIGDSQDTMKVTAFDRDAQEILYMQVEKALEIRSQKNGSDELQKLANRSLQSSYTFFLTLNSQNFKFLERSGYKVQMLDWIPRRCLRGSGSDSFQQPVFLLVNLTLKWTVALQAAHLTQKKKK